jgi:hypothetical protein
VGEAPEGRLDAPDDDGGVLEGTADEGAIGDERPVGTVPRFSAVAIVIF